jgi:hypothetical protein
MSFKVFDEMASWQNGKARVIVKSGDWPPSKFSLTVVLLLLSFLQNFLVVLLFSQQHSDS